MSNVFYFHGLLKSRVKLCIVCFPRRHNLDCFLSFAVILQKLLIIYLLYPIYHFLSEIGFSFINTRSLDSFFPRLLPLLTLLHVLNLFFHPFSLLAGFNYCIWATYLCLYLTCPLFLLVAACSIFWRKNCNIN